MVKKKHSKVKKSSKIRSKSKPKNIKKRIKKSKKHINRKSKNVSQKGSGLLFWRTKIGNAERAGKSVDKYKKKVENLEILKAKGRKINNTLLTKAQGKLKQSQDKLQQKINKIKIGDESKIAHLKKKLNSSSTSYSHSPNHYYHQSYSPNQYYHQ